MPCASIVHAGQDIKVELQKSVEIKQAVAKEKNKVEKQLKDVRQNLVQSAKKLQDIERSIMSVESEIQQVEQKKEYLRARLSEDKNLSSTLVHAVYQTHQMPPYSYYFSQEEKSVVVNRLIALKSGIPALRQRMQGWEEEIYSLNELEKELQGLRSKYQSKNAELMSQNKSLERLVEKRKSLFKKTSAQYQQQVQKVVKLQKEAKSVEELVRKLKPEPKPATLKKVSAVASAASVTQLSNGKFMPVVGRIKYKYGQKDEIGGKNNGLIFATQPNATAVSPMEGNVVFAGPFQNFKQLLIIEHNGGYHSLIGGLDNIQVGVGAKLKAGEPVGRIVHENETNGRLYFELRKDGKPINPDRVFKS